MINKNLKFQAKHNLFNGLVYFKNRKKIKKSYDKEYHKDKYIYLYNLA